MVGSCFRWLVGFAVAISLGLAGLHAQTTVTWVGNTNSVFETGSNYAGGSAPNSSDTLAYTAGDANNLVYLYSADSVAGLSATGSGQVYYQLLQGGSASLTIGSGGFASGGSALPIFFIEVPTILAANQAWTVANNGYVYESGNVSGAFSLTINGRVYFVGNDTYSGGTEITAGSTVNVGSNTSMGSGALTVDNGASLETFSGSGYTVANTTTFGAQVNLSNDSYSDPLIFSGTVTETTAAGVVAVGASSTVVFSGTFTGPSDGSINFAGVNTANPGDGGSQVVLTGSVTNLADLTVDESQVILAPTGNATTAFSSLDLGSLLVVNGGYLGFDGTFTTPGAVSSFLAGLTPSYIAGSIGFDSYGHAYSPNTFPDAVNLYNFTGSNFLGLGSATSAILSGTITPIAGNTFKFGGGGGTLTVSSSLNDDTGPTQLVMDSASVAPAALTVILTNNNNGYSGGTEAQGGVLIFDSSIHGAAGSISISGGYVGYTEEAELSPTEFLAELSASNFSSGVIGFDSHDVESPVTISGNIDVSAFSSASGVFLGSATAATLTGTITPSDDTYAFTGVKGGALTVQSDLTGSNALIIGLSTPLESNASQSSVTITGTGNTLTGPVTFNSGILYVASGSTIGTGAVTVPDQGSLSYLLPPTIETYNGLVNLTNNFVVSNFQSQYAGLLLGNPNTSDILQLSGVISDGSTPAILQIQGQVELTGMNTFAGVTNGSGQQVGVILESNGEATPTVYVSNTQSLGAASAGLLLQSNYASLIALNDVTIPNNIYTGGNYLNLGVGGSQYTLTLTGQIIGSGGGLNIYSNVDLPNANPDFSGEVYIQDAIVTIGNELSLGTGQLVTQQSTVQFGFTDPTIDNLSGDENSVVNLATGSTLTLFTTTPQTQYYYGTINADATSSVVKTGAGAEYLSGYGNSWGGGTTVSQGQLIAGNDNALGTGTITVASGSILATDSSATLTNGLTLSNGAILSGYGTFNPSAGIILANGTTIAPGSFAFGSGVGTLTIGSSGLTLGGGGVYSFNIATAGGSAGADYNTVSVLGTANVTALPTSPFTISLVSVDPGTGQAGLATFNSAQSYAWTILSATSITNFNASAFNFSTTSFQNGLGGGFLTLQQLGSTLVVDFTPVPEPSTWALIGGGTLLAGWVTIRRRRRT